MAKWFVSGIRAYGDTVHLFVERKNYDGPFMPGFREWESEYNPPSTDCYMLTIAWECGMAPDGPVG
jgi:4-hydroxyphenylpyruvate dioxygenase